jgi:predicted PurR-regulated permease PerM
MARLFDPENTLKRLRNRYRLVIMNDDTYEEVVTFKLSRLSVYVTFSTMFVLLVGLTVALITFTNLKYYLPGYGTQSQRRELILYKTKIDSLERAMQYKDQYLDNLKKVLSGDEKALDTATLQIPQVEKSTQ